MKYLTNYKMLKAIFDINKSKIEIPETDIDIFNLDFESQTDLVFPKGKKYYEPRFDNPKDVQHVMSQEEIQHIVKISDTKIKENRAFKFILFKPKKEIKSKEVIILFHGMNEQDWTKYLPWAKRLVELTQKSVLLFPIAFHMNRGLKIWANPRLMAGVSKERAKFFPNIKESSFINVASSTRLHFAPSRFFLSGLETYNDVIKLIYRIKENKNEHIDKNAKIDFFGYSAGAFLIEILLMANRDELFSNAKGFLFCGGANLEGMYLSSRYILDSLAQEKLHDFYLKDFPKHIAKDPKLAGLFQRAKEGGDFFMGMLGGNYTEANERKFGKLQEMGTRISALSLSKDTIIPPKNVEKTLKNSKFPNQVKLREMDFSHSYSHMMPFSYSEKIADEVDESFDTVFEYIADYFCSL